MKKVDILIIGGGIIGISAAYFLSKYGVNITLIEKLTIGREASAVNAGSLMLQNKELKLIPLAIEGVKIWSECKEMIKKDIEFRQKGGLRIAENIQQLKALRKIVPEQKKRGLEVEILSLNDE